MLGGGNCRTGGARGTPSIADPVNRTRAAAFSTVPATTRGERYRLHRDAQRTSRTIYRQSTTRSDGTEPQVR